jgi:hypothetical protein
LRVAGCASARGDKKLRQVGASVGSDTGSEGTLDDHQLFGEIAIAKGYVTKQQVREALVLQEDHARRGAPKLIGVLLVELKHLTPEQVMDVLEAHEARVASAPRIRHAPAPADDFDPLLPKTE